MKTYRRARELLREIEQLLAENKPAFGCSPLQGVIEILSRGRHYSWMGIYLTVGEKGQQLLGGAEAGMHTTAAPETRSKVLVSMKLASREMGVLAAESEREYPFGRADRVLLERVANLLARFLAGRGKYLVREAREMAATTPVVPARRPQSASKNHRTAAAVGEK